MIKHVIITLHEEYIESLPEIITDLHNMGMVVSREYDSGIVIGSVEEEKIENIRGLHVVQSVSEEKTIQISPPDAEIQ